MVQYEEYNEASFFFILQPSFEELFEILGDQQFFRIKYFTNILSFINSCIENNTNSSSQLVCETLVAR